MNKKVVLVIMDGWGIGPKDKYNAIDNANTPNIDMISQEFAYKTLKTDGENVGLSPGQFGTSEVNHRVIGTGRIILEALPKINKMIESGELEKNKQVLELVEHVNQNDTNLHLVGIVSDGGVHAHINHLFGILEILKNLNFKQNVYIHVFSDGRDVPPKSVQKYLDSLESKIRDTGIGKIATLQGRVYLDRDRDWEKTDRCFKTLQGVEGEFIQDWREAIDSEYKRGVDNDQYIERFIFEKNAGVSDGDGVWMFNFRSDRLHQIMKRILEEKIENLNLTGFINPSDSFVCNKILEKYEIKNSLAEVISDSGKTQYHVTETEKYVHLTYFLNGQREVEFPGESWEHITSNRFVKPYYNFEPSMRNFDTTACVIEKIKENKTDFIVINMANTDMVGHTGNYEAAVIAAESTDYWIGRLYEVLKDKLDEYVLIVTADHGNSDEMWDYDSKQPHTQHTLNPVPFVLLTNGVDSLGGNESLTSIAPTVLSLMGLQIPSEMQGASFV